MDRFDVTLHGASRGGSRTRSVFRLAAVAGAVALLGALLLATPAAARAPKSGQLLWARTIGAKSHDTGAWVLAAGPKGTTALAGWTDVQPTGQVPFAARYDAAGHKKWAHAYAAGTGYAQGVATDAAGDVYVAATVDYKTGDLQDIVLLKYRPSGALAWARSYDGPSHGNDQAAAVAVDRHGNVVVVGNSQGPSFNGIVALKYDESGKMVWPAAARYDADPADPADGAKNVADMAVDAAGNVYVTGASDYNPGTGFVSSPTTLKFASTDGTREWGQVATDADINGGYADAIAVRGQRVAISGSCGSGPTSGALVLTYDLAGHELHHRVWGAGNTLSEDFSDIALDAKSVVFVTGDQGQPYPGGFDKAVTMKLTGTLSKVVWKQLYLPKTKTAGMEYIALDGPDNCYVAGYVAGAHGYGDFLTAKYSAKGARRWIKVWSGGGPDDDDANGLALGTNGGVYVGGQCSTRGDITKLVLLKYQR